MKVFITKDQAMKKVLAAKKRESAKILKQIAGLRSEMKRYPDRADWLASRIENYEKDLKGFKMLRGIPFKVRSVTFASQGGRSRDGSHSYSSTVGLDLETGRAHSYQWYTLGQLIKGQYVVNSYRYSQQTSGHIYELRNTLEMLGVKYVELEAPSGLQKLEVSRQHYLKMMGEAMVLEKYALKKYPKSLRETLKRVEKGLALLAKFGLKTTKAMRAEAIASAEADRADRLEREKQDRLLKKFGAYAQALRVQDLRSLVAQTARLEKIGKLQEAKQYAVQVGAIPRDASQTNAAA